MAGMAITTSPRRSSHAAARHRPPSSSRDETACRKRVRVEQWRGSDRPRASSRRRRWRNRRAGRQSCSRSTRSSGRRRRCRSSGCNVDRVPADVRNALRGKARHRAFEHTEPFARTLVARREEKLHAEADTDRRQAREHGAPNEARADDDSCAAANGNAPTPGRTSTSDSTARAGSASMRTESPPPPIALASECRLPAP